ncbi:hypothetical protein F8M41_006248 [Gigaspora margarita]|uniref:Uncharacterized protein n=1 Tax=Gigaspora margarita TaxID=4874 RepID=A0A8H4AWU8_GIGMA|nr:hypothetical protein F8M41_006248 [Gigaspora margarita]
MKFYYIFKKPEKACDENLDNYQPSYRPLANILDILEEALIDYDESDLDSIYDSRNDEQLFNDMEVLTDSDETDTIEVDDMLKNMSSDFEGFEREYGPYFSNFTSAMFSFGLLNI